MEDLIPLVNKLQSVFRTTGMKEIKLPQIVVVGAQSTGKSSVLESLVGKAFLPRGSGIVPRCPIIIQLNQLAKDDGIEEYCRFSKFPDKTYVDFDQVREAIEEYQVKMAGALKGISMDPIILEIFSTNVINLTVVDLPGIVKVPLPGQPLDIEEQVFALINSYIENESAIILAVSAANADIATSESIKLANKVDPHGDRTLAVVTKLDLMDKGTDATDMLRGEVIKVKLGIIGVVNRSQQDLNDNTTEDEARMKEEKFLRKSYPQIHGIGSKYLGRRLNALLTEHINKNLPDLSKRVVELSTKCEVELRHLGQNLPTDPRDCAWLIMDVTVNFIDRFKSVIWKRGEDMRNLAVTKKVDGLFPVKLNAIFAQFGQDISEHFCNFDSINVLQRLKGTMNYEGFSSIEDVFKDFVTLELKKLETPAINCAREVHELLLETAGKCFGDSRLRYLNGRVRQVVDELLYNQLEHVIKGIGEHFELEKGMISTNDEQFKSIIQKFSTSEKEDEEADEDNKEEKAINSKVQNKRSQANMALPITMDSDNCNLVQCVQQLIATYVGVVRRQLSDYIPKYVMFHLAQQTIKGIPEAVKNATLGKETSLIYESEELRTERSHKQELLKNLNEASKILKEIRTNY